MHRWKKKRNKTSKAKIVSKKALKLNTELYGIEKLVLHFSLRKQHNEMWMVSSSNIESLIFISGGSN